jgi:acyl-homoserine lactone acylase PvdQ
MAERTFTTYRTHHGPVTRREGDRWITFRMMERPVDALRQSFLRTKAKDFRSFRQTMKIRTNSSNNTVFADAKGNIAYWHGNFVPRRNSQFDYNGVVDGSNPATDWQGIHQINDLVEVRNPATGWLQNCNATPFTVAGPDSPDPADYFTYSAPDPENFRGLNAVRVLSRIPSFDLDSLIAAANDPYLTAFEDIIPALVRAYRANPQLDPRGDLAEAIDLLDDWDFRYGENSVATALAVYWGERIWSLTRPLIAPQDYAAKLMMDDLILKYGTPQKMVDALRGTKLSLQKEFGDWRTPWGEINRFQRRTGDIDETYDDNEDSIPVGFTSSRWGSLASFGARTYPGTVRRYGSGGNSFVAVVEFGKPLRARAVVSGGQSGDPDSPHFTDQAELFCKGQFREVYFYRPEVEAHAERTYRPGE